MKKVILIILASLLLFGCEKKSKIELIPNYDADYYADTKVTEQAKPIDENFESTITEEFRSIITDIYQKSEKKQLLFPVGYRLYINTNGDIDKIEKVESIEIVPKKDFIFNFKNELYDEITKRVLPKMEQWKFTPAKLFDKTVAMRKDIKALYAAGENGKIEIKKPFRLNFINSLTNNFYVAVEEMPEPIGGIKAIAEKVKYPEIAKRAGIEGKVFIKAFIDSTGNVVKTVIIKGLGSGCDEAAVNAVKMTKFKPGVQRGKKVNVQVAIPILFKLQ